MRYLSDATFLIDYLRDEPGALSMFARLVADGDELFVNEVVVAEIWSGMRPSDEKRARQMLNSMEFIQPPPVAAERAGRWRAAARSRGWTLSLTDALIAAAAEAADAAVLTRNQRDFALTPVPVATY